MRAADLIANILCDSGIDTVFTVTGGGAMHLNDALGKHGGLKCTYNHHEQACSMAAEGYARVSGKPACVCVTTGPGGTNAITGVWGAYTDSVPMVVISGQVRYDTASHGCPLPLRQLGDQEYNIINSVKHMTKYSAVITRAEDTLYHLTRAINLAVSGRPGPVWLDVPLNIQAAKVDLATQRKYDPAEDAGKLPQPVSEALVSSVAQKLQDAKRPLIFAGLGIRKAKAYQSFLSLVEKANIPVVTAWNAHDLMLTNHRLNAGKPSTAGDRAGNFAVQNCDVMLVLGSRLNIRQISYNYENFAKRAYKIYVDIDEAELNKPTLNIDLKIRADLKDFIDKLVRRIEAVPDTEWHAYTSENVRRYPVVNEEFFDVKKPLNPYVFIDRFYKALPENQITVLANGTACIMGNQASITKKGSIIFANDGCASMGYGICAAIGAARGAGGAQIVCMEGDGSIQMNIQELQTISTNKLNIKIFMINNKGYHSIRQTQTNFFGTPLVGIGPESGDLGFPDYKLLAAAYSVSYYKIEGWEDVEGKIKTVLAMDGPVLCEVEADPTQFFQPKLSARKLEDGTLLSPELCDMYPFLDREEYDERMSISKK